MRQSNAGTARRAIAAALALSLIAGCATRSSSVAIIPSATIHTGPILVTRGPLPTGIEYVVVGSVQAEESVGYAPAASLYPKLADEARKIGANAVVNTQGGRRMTAFSWSAAYANGIAVRVADVQSLKAMPGEFH